MSKLTKAYRKYQPKTKELWDKARESEAFDDILGSIGLGKFSKYFKKETEPGSGVYESNLINPVSVTVAGIVCFLGYTIYKKKK